MEIATAEHNAIPQGWVECRLSELGKFSKGKGIRKDEVATDGFACVRYGEIYTTYNESIKSFNSFVSPQVAKTSQRIRKGDLLFAGSGETAEEIGKCTVVLSDDEAYAGGDVIIFSPIEQDSMFLGYLMSHSSISSQRAKMGQGDAVVHIYPRNLGQLKLLRPLLPEQRSIAAALSDMDALIASLNMLIAKKRDMKQAAMQELLTGKPRLPGFGGKWEVRKIGEFTNCAAGGTPSTTVEAYWGGQIPWMNSGELNMKIVLDVEGRITPEGLKNSSTRLIPPKCVLVGLAGQGKTRGTVAMNMVELCTNQSIAAIFPSTTFVSEYLYYNLDSRYDELRALSSGDSGRGGLNLTIIKSIPIPFPSTDEQQAIVTILSDMDAEIVAFEQKRDKTIDMKQGMMQELLTGRIRLM